MLSPFQARAPFSEVLIVGTHLDLLPKSNRQVRMDTLRHSIAKKYLDNQGFPKIVGDIMVSPVTGENIPELKEMIYSKALKVKDSGETIIGRRVSGELRVNYRETIILQLAEKIWAQVKRRTQLSPLVSCEPIKFDLFYLDRLHVVFFTAS